MYIKLVGSLLILWFLTWMIGYWYLIAAAIYAGLLPDKLSPIDRFDLCATWPYNLGIYIRDYIHGKLE